MKDVVAMIRDYVTINNLKTQFKDQSPGPLFVSGFMKRNNLSLKKGSMMCLARKANAGNPFIIYDMYDQLEAIKRRFPDLKPEGVFNCDESGFPVDPSRCRVVGPKGKECVKIRSGAGRENHTVLAVTSAAGEVCDPLIIFKGKNMQSSYRGKSALPNTFYGISENGWMDSDIYADWFEKFLESHPIRPLLLIFDGHLTHCSLRVVKHAMEQGVILFKLAPHITHASQPLDRTCFGPLKRRWNDA